MGAVGCQRGQGRCERRQLTDVVVRDLARETVGASTGELRVRGLVREVVVAPGVGSNRLLVQGLVREVVGAASAAGVGPKQYAVTIIT